MSIRAVFTGIGKAVPSHIMTNDDFSKIVDTNDEWIQQRTGIKQRRVCGQDEAASDLAYEASVLALKDAGISADEIDLIVVGTVTGDHPFPSTSCLIQEKLGAKNAGAFDVGAACAGFIYSVDTAAAMIESGRYKRVLVVGVDVLTKFMDWNDRATCVLFGDGAGAVVLEGHEGSDHGLIKTVLLANGEGACHITLEKGGSRYPQDREWSEDKNPHIYMNGREVYRFAVGAMGDACMKVLELAEMNTSDIDLFVPHQANSRIITAAAERLELPEERVFINVQDYGNTSGGSIPIALAEAVEQGRLKKGMVVMTVGFGAGLVWGANLIRW